jgi:peptide/nickel transport system substrate-binding protein
VRNPYFRASADRPAGFADRIELSVRDQAPAAGIASVQRGAADLLVVASPFGSPLSPRRMSALVASAPGRVHSSPAPTTEWMFLNIKRPPFDDIDVRKALNLATDRAALVALEGGPLAAVATCQILPTGFPGHEPYCPYSADPAPGRGWSGPDFERARRLIAASGTAGERVVVQVPDFKEKAGRYFVHLLDDLGFRARLRVYGPDGPDYFTTVYDVGSRAQMGFVGWGADYISPSTFIQPNFSCSESGDQSAENASKLCDASLARGVRRARAMPDEDAGPAWAALDHRIVDLAPAVPMTNRRTVVLVSKRVGNVTAHAQWFMLLDQLWVR